MTDVLELFGESTTKVMDWRPLVDRQQCPFLGRKCIKVRKSAPDTSIGTCSVAHSRGKQPMVICPFRLLERRKIFVDCLHLLSHEPGHELHVIPEVAVPGGSVDYFLTSVDGDKVVNFVGVELQTMDTTGSVWPARQRFLQQVSAANSVAGQRDQYQTTTYGMNWKMTAKTILVQLHHKIQTFEALGRHLVLVTQSELLEYLKAKFTFDHVSTARRGDSMQFHAYSFYRGKSGAYTLSLATRMSTDADGVGTCLGLRAGPKMEMASIVEQLERKLSPQTLLPVPNGR